MYKHLRAIKILSQYYKNDEINRFQMGGILDGKVFYPKLFSFWYYIEN